MAYKLHGLGFRVLGVRVSGSGFGVEEWYPGDPTIICGSGFMV